MTDDVKPDDAASIPLEPATIIPNNIHFFPPRKPRYTQQDHEDFSDARRLQQLRQAAHKLLSMHHDLHLLFGEVVKHDDAWPFFSVRQMQNYVEKEDFNLLTHNPHLLEAARATVRVQVQRNMAALTKVLLADTGLALTTVSGTDMHENKVLLRRGEKALELIRDIIDDASPEEKAALSRVTRVTQNGLKTMFNVGGTLSNVSTRAIQGLMEPTTPTFASNYGDVPEISPRRHLLQLAEHWLHVSASELHVMKLDLLADYIEPDRSPTQQDMFDGAIVQVTVPQSDFIAADAQSSRDLGHVDHSLHLALLS